VDAQAKTRTPRRTTNVPQRALPEVMTFALPAGAFAGAGHPDVAVHVPPRFDPTDRPGLVLYFHGWEGCATVALAPSDGPCSTEGAARRSANLSAQLDASGANALAVAVELRPDARTGEPGDLAKPGAARRLLRELLEERLAAPLGAWLPLDRIERIVVIAHSGGYQAAAAVLETGDLPQVSEVILLDALYGGTDIFTRWVTDDIARFDARRPDPLRFVDLYTCCAGTARASRMAARELAEAFGTAHLTDAVLDDDAATDGRSAVPPAGRTVVFQRLAAEHAELPRLLVQPLLASAGFATRR
jgi:hypothetical protein